MPRPLTSSTGGRFIVVGVVATAIDFTLLLLIDSLTALPVLLANVIATLTAFCFSFLANKKYTFRTSGSNLLREMILFTLFTLFGLWVLQSIVIYFSLPIIEAGLGEREMALIIAKLLATVVSTIWNYLTYSRIVFARRG